MEFIKVGDYVINARFVTHVELESPEGVNVHVTEEIYNALREKEQQPDEDDANALEGDTE